MSYATVAELRALLTQMPTGAAYDELLEDALDGAAGIIDGVLGFAFGPWALAATDKDVQARNAGVHLYLPPYKAASVTAVALVGSRATTGEYETAVTDYVAEEDARPFRLYRGMGWYYGSYYRVTAIWGYGPAPAVVAAIALDVAKNSYANRNSRTVPGSSVVGIDNTLDVSRILTSEQYLELMNVRTQTIGVPHG